MTKQDKMDLADYMKDRVDDQLQWLESKSASNKGFYQFWKLIVILTSVSIPLFVTFLEAQPMFKYVIAGAGVLIAAIEGILSLYNNQSNWINYRQTAESLKREKLMFLTQAGFYKTNPGFQTFVERVETILGDENKKWASYVDEEVEIQGAKGQEEAEE